MILSEKKLRINGKDQKIELSMEKIALFQEYLKRWHGSHRRYFPWVGEKDPYKIWLSEIILQQTRVEQGLPYYKIFLKHFPTMIDLSKGEEQLIFRLWQGLGYYNRCKNLIKTAKIVTEKYNGKFPDNYEEIIDLPGIGPYTAAAIASFAFGLPYAVVDGNVERFLSRYYGIEVPVNTAPGKKLFTKLASLLLDEHNPAEFNQAMMDFGATQCLPKNPPCSSCCFQSQCIAWKEQSVPSFPVKKKKVKIKKRYLNYYVFCYEDRVYIRKRASGDIWQNLHDFFLYESEQPFSKEALLELSAFKEVCPKKGIKEVSALPLTTHQLTHQKLMLKFVMIFLNKSPLLPETYFPVKLEDVDHYAFPRPLVRFLNEIRRLGNYS